jgi:hypothetical protein
MEHTEHTQNPKSSPARRDLGSKEGTTLPRVRQDKGVEYAASQASSLPASAKKSARLASSNSNTPRSQNKFSAHTKAAKVTIWLHPRVKAELTRLADLENLSLSATGGAFIEEGIRQKLHTQHSVLLQPIIETAIRREMQAQSNRLALLLVRVAFDAGQIRAIVTNLLARHPGVTPELLKTILEGSSNTAKRNIKERSPQLEEIITELAHMFAEGEAP